MFYINSNLNSIAAQVPIEQKSFKFDFKRGEGFL